MQYRTHAGVAIAIPFAASVWLFTVPNSMSAVTFVALALLAIGAGKVALDTWRNGQGTGSVGELLHATEAAGPPQPDQAEPTSGIRSGR